MGYLAVGNGKCILLFLPFLVGVSAAEHFECNKYLALTLVRVMMYPTWETLLNEGVNTLYLFGAVPMKVASYSSSMVSALLSVYCLSKFEKGLYKIVPKSLQIILVPIAVIVVMEVLALAVIGPLGAALIRGVTGGYFWLYERTAALAVCVKTRNRKLKSLAATGALVTGIGITESVLYGVCLPLKRPLIISMVSSGSGGAFMGVFRVTALGVGMGPLGAIPVFLTDTFVYWVIGILGTAALSFIGMCLFGYKAGQEHGSEKYK